MKTPIGVALIVCGTILLIFPFAYYLFFLFSEMYVVAQKAQLAPPATGLVYGPRFGIAQNLVGLFGLLMIFAGVAGTHDFKRKSKNSAASAPSSSDSPA